MRILHIFSFHGFNPPDERFPQGYKTENTVKRNGNIVEKGFAFVCVHVLGTLSMLSYLETWLLAQTSLPIPPPPHQSPSLVCSLVELPLDHPLVSPVTLVFHQSPSRTKHQSPGQLPAQHSSILSGQGFRGLGHRQLSCWKLPGPQSLPCSGVPFT